MGLMPHSIVCSSWPASSASYELFYWAVFIGIKFGFDLRWEAQSNASYPRQRGLRQTLNQLWEQRPSDVPEPTKVSVTLTSLKPSTTHTPSLLLRITSRAGWNSSMPWTRSINALADARFITPTLWKLKKQSMPL